MIFKSFLLAVSAVLPAKEPYGDRVMPDNPNRVLAIILSQSYLWRSVLS